MLERVKNVRSSREIIRLKKRTKQRRSNDMLERKGKCFKMNESKQFLHGTYKTAKRPSDWGKMIDWVTRSKILRYQGKCAKSKPRKRKKYQCTKKKKPKKKVSKCKSCNCKKLKGIYPCHKKQKAENVITKSLQDFLRYKSKRKRKQESVKELM